MSAFGDKADIEHTDRKIFASAPLPWLTPEFDIGRVQSRLRCWAAGRRRVRPSVFDSALASIRLAAQMEGAAGFALIPVAVSGETVAVTAIEPVDVPVTGPAPVAVAVAVAGIAVDATSIVPAIDVPPTNSTAAIVRLLIITSSKSHHLI